MEISSSLFNPEQKVGFNDRVVLDPVVFAPAGDKCPLCRSGSLILRVVRCHDAHASDDSREFTVLQCPGCDFAWQWPLRRSVDSSIEYFQDNYRAVKECSYFDKTQKREICVLEMEFIKSLLSVGGSRLLDLGSGDGTFAEVAFENGWDVWAVDPAGAEKDETQNGRHLRQFRGQLTDLDDSLLFDVITMWDVVEHLEKPLDLIGSSRRRLAPGGWLVLETGNFQSTGRVLAGKDWWCYQNDHRWYFTPQVLQELLEGAGFDTFRICRRTLRPWVLVDGHYTGPSVISYLLASLRRPWCALRNFDEFRQLNTLHRQYASTAHLQIFTLAAQASR